MSKIIIKALTRSALFALLMLCILSVAPGADAGWQIAPNPGCIAQISSDQPQLRGLHEGERPDQIRTEAQETEGALFEGPDTVLVQKPPLKALIQLRVPLSPYQLEGESEQPITLKDVLRLALENNLAIKISHTDQESSRWQYYGSLGGFLPDLDNAISYQGITGSLASPFGVLAPVRSPFLAIPNSLNYYFFQGGKVLFGAIKGKHEYRAAQEGLKGTTNDVLFEATKLYYQLVLNDVLLQVRIKSVETSDSLLAQNQNRFENGANTKLDVLQARTLLSRDKQNLITQQIARRKSAIDLATALNINPVLDYIAQNRNVRKIVLVDPSTSVPQLVGIAIDNRPELKRFEQLRLAAKAAIKVALAPLFPTVQGQGLLASTGAKVSPTSTVVQSSANTAITPGPLATSSVVPIGTSSTSPTKFRMAELYALGLDIEWKLGGMGTIDAANVQSAKWKARKAQLEFNQELAQIYKEVREAYLDSLEAENEIYQTTDTVNSSRQQLQVASDRLQQGVGTDIDAVNAQRDYTAALVDKANAIVKYNVSQAQLLQAIGRISTGALTSSVPLKD
jgi:outer membrane protein